ncbi:MAG: MBL fold metallo-hydrolase [Candidatus Methanofastidiosa archaeon]|nr:MBL fold metallo-hydrolase [Candidatus Methanofastidiosa archaeon]
MSIKISCICDNNVKLSSHLLGEHGISFHIDDGKDMMLFDTGQSYHVLSHNARQLRIDLDEVDKIILSHGHYDHTGGLDGMLEHEVNEVIGHPDMLQKKYKLVSDLPEYIGIPLGRNEIEGRSKLTLSRESFRVSRSITTTGEIPRVNEMEAVPDIFLCESDGIMLKDDILDDQSIIVNNSREAILLLGCNHSGIMNTLEHAKRITDVPIVAIAGGTHLVAADNARMERTISYLREEKVKLYGFHCTGDKASHILKTELGQYYEWGRVGTILEL